MRQTHTGVLLSVDTTEKIIADFSLLVWETYPAQLHEGSTFRTLLFMLTLGVNEDLVVRNIQLADTSMRAKGERTKSYMSLPFPWLRMHIHVFETRLLVTTCTTPTRVCSIFVCGIGLHSTPKVSWLHSKRLLYWFRYSYQRFEVLYSNAHV